MTIQARPKIADSGALVLDITASCDSLQVLVSELEAEVTALRSGQYEEVKEVIKEPPIQMRLLITIGLLILIVGIVLGAWGYSRFKQ